ncbi:hypothetical protein, partial [Frankia sp. CcWB3]
TGGRGGGRRGGGRGELSSVVVDCENGFLRLGLAQRLAGALGGITIPLDALHHLTPRAASRTTSGEVAC